MERIPLDQAFEFFCDGASSSGPYWDHVLGYWKASLDQPDRILFLKYEDMKENTAFYTRKLAEFIGYGFTLEEEGKGVVGKIVRMCSFDYLRNLEVNKSGKVGENTPWEMENKVFYRKSTVKDWENYLTPEMAAHMDFITQQKLSDSASSVVEVLIIRALKWHGQRGNLLLMFIFRGSICFPLMASGIGSKRDQSSDGDEEDGIFSTLPGREKV
ncbi:cytosolic sulfotransferase 16-like [Hibiscus syriacus]|uniref:cytosolic sulfotransferase 16-like n=1 Tax=Hibiscus syriacus TaxID=106335 RepID=UPI001921E7B1|nr:cytosolic sulfotransferase 16-like [Hibiscus syriacus]